MDQTPYQQNHLQNRIRAIWRKKVRPVWQDYHWAVVVAGLVAFSIVLWGALQVLPIIQIHLSSFKSLAGYLGAALTLYAAGKALALLFRQQIQAMRLSLTHNHVVVCGMGDKGSLFTQAFYEDGYKVVAIEKEAKNSRLGQVRDLDISVLIGNATDQEILRQARVHKARYLVAVCHADGDNAEIAMKARTLAAESENEGLTCLVHITDPLLCSFLKEREIMAQRSAPFRMEFFNVYESGARQLIKEFPGFGQGPLDSQPHILIVGLGAMGKSLAVHLTMLWRIAQEKSKKKLPITIVDPGAAEKREYLQLQYRQLNDFWDLAAVNLEVDSPQFSQANFLRDAQGNVIVTMVYVCLEKDSDSLSAALALFQHLRHEKVPVVVQMDHEAGLAKLLRSEADGGDSFANLHSFGLLDRKCKADLLLYGTHEMLARAIHQDYLWSQEKLGLTLKTNPSLLPWEELPENLKESNRRQADDIGKKLKMVFCDMEPLTDWDAELFEFTPEEIETLSRREHHRWLAERRNEGWIYEPGPKSLSRKTSPFLLDWEELPEDFKKLNREAIRSLPIFLAQAGFQILRTGARPEASAKMS